MALMYLDASRVRTRTDGSDRAWTQLPQPLQLLDRRGEVGIADEDPVAHGRPDAFADRVALAVITRATDQPDSRVERARVRDEVGGLIRRTVIHDHDFPCKTATVKVSAYAFQRRP
jgi:hypothetical protein